MTSWLESTGLRFAEVWSCTVPCHPALRENGTCVQPWNIPTLNIIKPSSHPCLNHFATTDRRSKTWCRVSASSHPSTASGDWSKGMSIGVKLGTNKIRCYEVTVASVTAQEKHEWILLSSYIVIILSSSTPPPKPLVKATISSFPPTSSSFEQKQLQRV